MFLGIDVGTGSARAAVFDAHGKRLGMGTHPIEMWRPADHHVEQSSEDIWRACAASTKAALREAGVRGDAILGIGFDATCSLVLLGADDAPVTASTTGKPDQNVIVWMDHRATEQAARINATGHEVLRYVGGVISPEMQTPKLVWLAEQRPDSFTRTARFMDLPDFLAYRATGVDARSLCTTVCKWTYLAHAGGWQPDFFQAIGLGMLADEAFRRIGTDVRGLGERQGELSERAASELGLAAGIPVGVAIIDAHAGGLGLIGVADELTPLEQRLALVGGTSSCHLAIGTAPRFIHGVWGPYLSALLPGTWLTEGGQSATGALIDATVRSHVRGAELEAKARGAHTTVYALLNERLDELARASPVGLLGGGIHVLPDHLGNRSPRADPTLRGVISGLELGDTLDQLAVIYLATIQGIAHGTRHVIDAMTAGGYKLDVVIACGGDTKNRLFLQEHADAIGRRIVLPEEPEAVLLGAAILAAVASGAHSTLLDAMAAMTRAGRVVEPRGGEIARFHEHKHAVFLRMHDDQLAYRALMRGR